MRHFVVALLCVGLFSGCARRPRDPAITTPPMVPDPVPVLPEVQVPTPLAKIHVDSVLASLSMRQKVGQVVMPWLFGNYAAYESDEYDTLAVWIDSLEVGGIVISIGSPLDVAAKLNAMQRQSRLPLLIAADLEWGAGMRLIGGTSFPMPMAIGATNRGLDAYELGRVTALEARAVGIHLTFSPVADVNNNPKNPIINTRSFGEDPEAVGRLIAAYVRGAEEHGLRTTAKHFPGHGDTDIDSHIELPVVRGCWPRLDSLELAPFRAAVTGGVTAIMTAHVALPCIATDSALPATLSPTVTADILRDSLAFGGLVVTDALNMGAVVRRFGPGESAVLAFLAGADILLYPSDVRAAVEAMVHAVESGRVSRERLDRSVRRVLALKGDLGLFQRRTVPLDQVPTVVGHRQFRAIADDVAARALTLVQRGTIDSFRTKRSRVALITYAEETNLSIGGTLTRELLQLGDTVAPFRLYPASGALSYDSARTVIARNPRVIFAPSVRFLTGRGHIALPDSLAALITATAAGKPTVVVSFGSPYLLNQLTAYEGAYLLAWSNVAATERAVARVLAGGAPVRGRLPITLDERYPRGWGVELEAAVRRIGGSADRRIDQPLDSTRFAEIGEYLAAQVDSGAFPGGVLYVGYRGDVAYRHAFGRYGLDDPRPVGDSTVYDLASLTKVIGLTTAVMLLVAEGRLDIERPVAAYVPEFSGSGKDGVLVRHLLTHTAGLEAWVPLHLSTPDRRAAIRRVLTEPLQSPPGERYVYSDLGAITLTQVVERVAGQSLDAFLEQRLFTPLGMRDTRFRPPERWRRRIAPTEDDPWRKRMVRGEVHDENAAHLGGVSGHAGLFSTAPDLARFARWLLDAYHDRLPADAPVRLPSDVVRAFTRKQPGPPGSTRALGWDTPDPGGRGSSGSRLSPAGFGHTGFTGTSIWMDPTRELFIILLTNRVHPTRENNLIRAVRREVADRVVCAVDPGACER